MDLSHSLQVLIRLFEILENRQDKKSRIRPGVVHSTREKCPPLCVCAVLPVSTTCPKQTPEFYTVHELKHLRLRSDHDMFIIVSY